jgi:hypothetical protein
MLEEAREDHKENDAQHMRRGCEMPLEAASLKTLLIYRRIRFVCNKHVLLLHRHGVGGTMKHLGSGALEHYRVYQ